MLVPRWLFGAGDSGSATVIFLAAAPVALAWFLSRSRIVTRTTWLSLLNVGANFGGIGLAFGFMASVALLSLTFWLVRRRSA